MLLLSTGDGLGEKLPVTKSQMLPVTPFKPVNNSRERKEKKEEKKNHSAHTAAKCFTCRTKHLPYAKFILLSAIFITLFHYLQKCESLENVHSI